MIYTSAKFCFARCVASVASVALLFAAASVAGGCAAVTKAQIHEIENFALKCDSAMFYPSALYEEIGKIRLDRGVYFSATINDPQGRVEELQQMYKSWNSTQTQAKAMDKSAQALASYMRALKSLSSKNRYSTLGTNIRNLGRDLDSMVYYYNSFDPQWVMPQGFIKLGGKVVALAGETFMQHRQKKALKSFVAMGDTIVQTCCNGIIDLLRSESTKQLIENEKSGLEENFKSFLLQCQESHYPLYDREYLQMLNRADNLSRLSSRCVSACRSVAYAHKKLLKATQDKRTFKEFYDSALTLYDTLDQLCATYKKLLDKWQKQ